MYLSRVDIEKIAEKVLLAYYSSPKVKIQKDIESIDPFIIAENILGLKIDFQNLSRDKCTYGLTSYYPTLVNLIDDNDQDMIYPLDGNTILVDKDLAFEPLKGKFNFTISHETSHHILRKLFPNEYGPQINDELQIHYYKGNTQKITDWEEWQASTLASSILLPKDLIIKNMKSVGIGETLEILSRKHRFEDFVKFCTLATTMGVSITALRIRMNYLGLIKKDYLYNPQRIYEIDFER